MSVVQFRLEVPDLTCAVCRLPIRARVDANGLTLTHAHGGCDDWRSLATRPKCVGRVQLTSGLMLRIWPKGESEFQSIL